MKYDNFISLGSSCCPGLSMRELKIKTETYPFDWVRVNNKIILDILLNGPDKFLSFFNVDTFMNPDSEEIDVSFFMKDMYMDNNKGWKKRREALINAYGSPFLHYVGLSAKELERKFSRYIDRFFQALDSKQNILFIQSHEDYILHGKSRANKDNYYNYLKQIDDHIRKNYPELQYDIINIDIDNNHENYGRIINLNIKYNKQYSVKWEHHDTTVDFYRDQITKAVNHYLNAYN